MKFPKMAVDANRLFAMIQRRNPRGPINIYMNKDLYKEFKSACGKYPISRVLEQLMRDFIATNTKKKYGCRR